MPAASKTRKPVIGLIGGIGSGKSMVARQFEQLGCGVIDSDQLARQAMSDPKVRRQLANWWGPGVLQPDGQVDRRAVGKIVFDKPEELARLEELIHPLVHAGRAALRQRYNKNPAIGAIVEDTPLLLEKALDGDCDLLVFVACARANRVARLAASRGWDEAELDRREKRQLPLDIKARRADYMVDNNAGPDECLAQVRLVLCQILKTPPQ